MSPPRQEGPTSLGCAMGFRGCGIGGWLRQSVPQAKESSRWDGGQLSREPCLLACARCSRPALLPLLKAHRFSHSLEKAGQEWLSPGSAMGQACGVSAAGIQQELSRESLPGWGCQQEGRGLLQRAARCSSWWDPGAGVPAMGTRLPCSSLGGGQALAAFHLRAYRLVPGQDIPRGAGERWEEC